MSRRMTELLQSLGFNELQVLLHNAALLEKKLEEEDDCSSDHVATARPSLETNAKANRSPDSDQSRSHSKHSDHDISLCITKQHRLCLLRRPCSRALQMPSSNFSSQKWAVSPSPSLRWRNSNTNVRKTLSNPRQSPRRCYLSSFRRLASSSGVIPSIFTRKSYSTSSDISSEDLTSVPTPPDHANTDYLATGQHLAGVVIQKGHRAQLRELFCRKDLETWSEQVFCECL
jgi:hypothetical protein